MSDKAKIERGSVLHMLADSSTPEAHKRDLLRMLAQDPRPEAGAILQELFTALSDAKADALTQEKQRMLDALLQEMQAGPVRVATFVQAEPPNGTPVHHAQVVLDDGSMACVAVPDPALAESLRAGDRIALEAQGRAVLRRFPHTPSIGEEARLERRVDERRVVVSVRGQDRHVFLASQSLIEKLNRGEITHNAAIIVNPRHGFAYDGLPPEDGCSNFRYLDRAEPPDILVSRDIGAPPSCISEIERLVRSEMTRAGLRRKYRLPSCGTWMLAGVSGSGKTLAIHAIWRLVYEIMSEVTGRPIDQLPPRVFRLRPGDVFSKWFGESDKNLERFFDEVEALAKQTVPGSDGREHRCPVLVVLEELDGIGRARGQEPVYDRVMTTALRRLDPSRQELQQQLIVFLATTNEPQLVDRALFRRTGGRVERFGRLKRAAFRAVLRKHLAGRPVASHNGTPQSELEEHLVASLTDWLFSPNGSDRGLIDINYVGSNQSDLRYRRDFLTGAVVEAALRQAAETSCRLEWEAQDSQGLTVEQIVEALDQQIRNLADQVSEHNAAHYLDLPEAARVAAIRRLPQPALFPMQLQG